MQPTRLMIASATGTARGVIAGANMVLVELHPAPHKGLVDGRQSLQLHELPYCREDVRAAREAYEKRSQLAKRLSA